MKKKMRFLNLLAVLIVLFTGVYQANAANLQARSQVISAANGYPNWYQDLNNLALSLCLDQNGFCLVDATPLPFPANRADISDQNFPPEAFYYMADTSGVSPGGTISLGLYEAALEAGFATVQADGQQAVFTRIRIRADVTVPGTYTVTHPYGVDTFVVTAIGPGLEINFTEDVPGLVANQFDTALTSRVGPFLTRADGIFPIDPVSSNKYIGVPGALVLVTGSPTGVNSVTITGPTADTLTLNTFSLMGKVIGLTLAPTVGGTDFGVAKLSPALGVTKNFTVQNLTANPFTPVIAANVPNITPVTPSPDFTIVPAGCAAPLAPNATCNFDVTFIPTTAGLKTATIIVSGPDVPPAQTSVTGTGDGTPPTVTIDAPLGKFFTKLPTQIITGTVADNVGGAGIDPATSVQVTVNAAAPAAATVTGGTWSFTATGLNTADVVNNNSISVTAADLALPLPGNISAPVTGTITVDSIHPAVAITSPLAGLTNTNTPLLTFTATDTNFSGAIVEVDLVQVATVSGTPLAPLAEGPHSVRVEALDSAGNATVATVLFTVDTLPPVQTLTSPAAGGFTNDNTPLLTFSTTDATAVANVFSVDGEVVITAPGESLALLTDGPHTLVAVSTDAAGNTSTTTPPATFTVDTVLPQLALTAPVAGLTKINTPLLTFTASDLNGVTNVVKVDGAVVAKLSGENLALLADGQHTVRVETTDAAGNISSSEVIITVDATPPVISLTAPAAAGFTNDNTPLLTFSVADSTAVTNVVKVDGVIVTKLSGDSLALLADGAHTVIVESTDAAGNFNSATANFTVDTVLPQLALTAPAAGLTKINTPTLTFTATDINAVTNVVKVDGAVVAKLSGENLALLADGQHTLRVETTDAAGNSAFAEVIITVDATPPLLTLNAVSTPTFVTTQTISGTVEAGATVTVNGLPINVSGATWSFEVSGLVEGVNNITVTATDPAGNTVSQQSSILIVLQDGKITGGTAVTIADAQKALLFSAGLTVPTPVELLHADVAPLILVNGKLSPSPTPNGKVDIGDVVLILRKVVDQTSW